MARASEQQKFEQLTVAAAVDSVRGMTVPIERVPAADTIPLRHRVLRSHQDISEVALPGDDDPETGHFAAIDEGEVIGTASVRREPPPWPPPPPAATLPAWRLRGMATADGRRGEGIGGAVLAAAVAHVAASGGGLLWCSARQPAEAFYRRAGFEVIGEPWDDPDLGPHVAMYRLVVPDP